MNMGRGGQAGTDKCVHTRRQAGLRTNECVCTHCHRGSWSCAFEVSFHGIERKEIKMILIEVEFIFVD